MRFTLILTAVLWAPIGVPEERPIIPDRLCLGFREWQYIMRVRYPWIDRSVPSFARHCMMKEV